MKLQEVAEARGTVDAHQDAVLHGRAEAHGQAVGACAGPVVGRPGVEDEASALPEDVRGASCESKERGSVRTLQGSSQLRLRCRDSAQGAVGHDGLHVPGCGDQEGCSAGAQKTPSPQIKEAGEMSYQKAGARERRSSRLQVLLNKGRGRIARHV